jgi:heptosyltransferase-2
VIRHPVACSPCGLRECPIDLRCMKGVTVEDVSKSAVRLVEELGITHERPA